MSSDSPRIAIIGGGPGGLTLLNVLARHGIPATLYERDADKDSRAQLGGTLDLHARAGQAAMRGAGLWEQFLAHAREEGEERVVTDRTGVPLVHYVPDLNASGKEMEKPEIDRRVLRELLVQGAPEGSIRWGHAFEGAVPSAEGRGWTLTFANGATASADLLIGADGARSRVRPLVSAAQPEYTGWVMVELWFHSKDKPELAARVGQGTLFAIDDGKRIAAQRNGDGRIRVYGTFPAPEDYKLPEDDPVGATLAQFEGWGDWLRELIASGEKSLTVLRPIYVLPPGHSWPHREGVTLVGDAMNLMSTFAAKGANVAMLAGLVLGESIAKAYKGSREELNAAVADYEAKICKQAGEAAAESAANMKNVLSEGGAERFAARVRRAMEQNKSA